MNCPRSDVWELLSLGLLSDEESEAVRVHAQTCAACRERLLAAQRDHWDLDRLHEQFGERHDQRREQLMAALPPTPTAGRRPHARRPGEILMSLNIKRARAAALALLPAACIVAALALFLTSSPTVAFADVVQHINAARTMTCDNISIGGPGGPAITSRLSMYCNGQACVHRHDLPDNLTVWTLPDRVVTRLPDGTSMYTMGGSGSGPEEWLNVALEACEEPDALLGESVINGRQVVGFEVRRWNALQDESEAAPMELKQAAPPPIIRIWADVETQLPVRIEFVYALVTEKITEQGRDGVRLKPGAAADGAVETVIGTWDNIRWDVALDPADFEPPADAIEFNIPDFAVPQ